MTAMSISCWRSDSWPEGVSTSTTWSSTWGRVRPEAGDGAQQPLAEGRGDHSDPKPADQAGLGLGGDIEGALGGGHEPAALGGERAAGLGEGDLAAGPVQEPAFQLQDGLAQGRLGHAELFGGPADVEGLGDGEEVAGLANLDNQSLRI
jgi:hypothetical protein